MTSLAPTFLGWLVGLDLQFLLVGLVLLAVVILVGRFVLHVAWRLVILATLAVGGVYLITLFAPGLI